MNDPLCTQFNSAQSYFYKEIDEYLGLKGFLGFKEISNYVIVMDHFIIRLDKSGLNNTFFSGWLVQITNTLEVSLRTY